MSSETPIQIVNYKQSLSIQEKLHKRCGAPSKDGYEIWKRYHDELCAVAERFGKVGYRPDEAPDFYHTGDWFHELADGFMLNAPGNFSRHVFAEFQEVVAKHHPDASMALSGGALTIQEWRSIPPLYGLGVFIRPSTIHVSWMLENVAGCIRKLRAAGVDFESWQD
jgi:hypothetical protein